MMKLDYRTTEALETSLHQAAADQALAELASVVAWHNAQELLEAKRKALARTEADLQQAESEAETLSKEFERAGEKLFSARHFEQVHRPPLWDGGVPVKTAHTRDGLNERVTTAERELRDASAVKRDARQRVTGLQQEIKELQREISLLSELTPPGRTPGLEAIKSHLGGK